jgi:hypothetical protein
MGLSMAKSNRNGGIDQISLINLVNLSSFYYVGSNRDHATNRERYKEVSPARREDQHQEVSFKQLSIVRDPKENGGLDITDPMLMN